MSIALKCPLCSWRKKKLKIVYDKKRIKTTDGSLKIMMSHREFYLCLKIMMSHREFYLCLKIMSHREFYLCLKIMMSHREFYLCWNPVLGSRWQEVADMYKYRLKTLIKFGWQKLRSSKPSLFEPCSDKESKTYAFFP